MRFTLKALHHNGVVLTAEQLADAPRHTGNLVIEDWPQGGTVGRNICQARLLDETVPQARRDVIPPLFGPQLARMTDGQMALHGYQIHADAETGAVVHFTQIWLLRFAMDL